MQYSNMFFQFGFQLSLQATSRNPVPSQTQRRFLTPALVAEVAEAARAQYEAQAQAIHQATALKPPEGTLVSPQGAEVAAAVLPEPPSQQVCNYRIICLGLLTVTHASFL